jgi:circadian clock protein KaiC
METTRKQIEREPTGVPGLDEALKGGLPKDIITLVTGTPGSGKTTLSMQFLIYGAQHGEKGIYFTLEESAADIIEQAALFDPSVNDLIASNMLKIVEVPIVDYDSMKETISAESDALDAKRIVIDSVNYFQMFFPDIISIRRAIMEVSLMLKSRHALGILIGEIPSGEDKLSTFGVEEFAADGVIALYLLEKQGTFTRAMRIVKMRNTDHITKFMPIEITDKGLVVYPNAELFQDV